MLDLADRLSINDCRWGAPAASDGVWYPHRFTEPLGVNEPFLSHAIDACDRAVDEAVEQGATHVVLIGFSQGACLASEYVLRRPGRCAALVMFTGGLIGPPGRPWRLAPPAMTLGGLPALLTGSNIDEWVPEARVRETAKVLKAMGADVRLRIYADRAHVVCDEELVEAREFIKQLSTLKSQLSRQ